MAIPVLEDCKSYSDILTSDNTFKFNIIFEGVKVEIERIDEKNTDIDLTGEGYADVNLAMYQWIDHLWRKEIGTTQVKDIDVTIIYGKEIPIEVSRILATYDDDYNTDSSTTSSSSGLQVFSV